MNRRLFAALVLVLAFVSTSFAQTRQVWVLNDQPVSGIDWLVVKDSTVWEYSGIPMMPTPDGSELTGTINFSTLPPGEYGLAAIARNELGVSPASAPVALRIEQPAPTGCTWRPRFIFADGFVWRAPDRPTRTILTLTNSDVVDQTVAIRYMLQSGTPIDRAIVVPSYTRREIDLNFLFTVGSTKFGTIVEFQGSGSASLVMWLGGQPNGTPIASVPFVEGCR